MSPPFPSCYGIRLPDWPDGKPGNIAIQDRLKPTSMEGYLDSGLGRSTHHRPDRGTVTHHRRLQLHWLCLTPLVGAIVHVSQHDCRCIGIALGRLFNACTRNSGFDANEPDRGAETRIVSTGVQDFATFTSTTVTYT